MKLVAFCLFAVCCCTLAMPTTRNPLPKLQETLKDLHKFQRNIKNITTGEVHMPTKNFVQDCGCLSALKCFQDGIETFNLTNNKLAIKLVRSLRHPSTIHGLKFCAKDSTPSCSECNTHPAESVDHFFSKLETLLQEGITKLSLSMD